MVKGFRKRLSVSLVMILALFTLFQSVAFGAEVPSKSHANKPFPSQTSNLRTFAFALSNGNIGNELVQALVGPDGRFNAGLKETGSDNWFNILFSWPSDPWSSFTTLKVDGEELIYGNTPDGEFIQNPTNSDDSSKNESVWKTGDITVKQVLQAGLNPSTGQPDALEIKYIVTNTGTSSHEVGLRMMLDTMVDGNDSAPFKVPNGNEIESINYEKDYVADEVPAFWQVFNDFDNPDISAQYTMSGRDATIPDRFTIASWGGIQGTKWDYEISEGSQTGDSGVGMWWNPKTLAPGEQKVITTYYGRPGVGGDQALVLSGRQKLTYEEWSSNSFNLLSYFTNNSESTLNNVRLVLEADSGITLVDDDSEHSLGTINRGVTTQSSWKLQPNTHGKHKVTVKAFADDSGEPFATADFEVEALEPVVPPNINLEGSSGTSQEGTPVAGRMSPLTVNASFDDPKAEAVTLIATDADGKTYEHKMETTNGSDWTHTFTPSNEGLWGSPMTIKVIPRYADGTTGEALEFPVVLIDPSGFIYNENKGEEWKLPGATVVLQYFDPQIDTWVTMSEEAYPGRMSPITNPQVTGSDGRYAWDAAEGTYRVVVSRPGFETTTSREVVIPPPVTDLDVALKPTDDVKPTITSTGISDSGMPTEPVTIKISSEDNEAGVRFITYKIDGNDAVKATGDNVTLPAINSFGQHTVILTAVDHAGNEAVKEIKFEVKNPGQVNEDMMPIVTVAIDKTKLSQTSIKTALDKINTNSSKTLINDELSKSLAANAEAKIKITRLKELLNAYNSLKVPASQLTVLRNNVAIAEQQNLVEKNKLNEAIATTSLSTAKTKTSDALRANGLALNYLEYIKANLKAYGVK
ncbi:carboxypeptidase-like regulatory domain-containing protein [Mesobacillus foraminis]|uniref:carboxypeptidase-like regulatory domain-containing protein n=1 Tax=Mesobacillus foraminis TaxID=279826 RepID=UPI0039A07332